MINQIFESIAANNSRNFKIDYLNQHKDNEVFKEVIRLALDPYTQFYQRKIPAYETYNTTFGLEWAIDELRTLSSRTVTGNTAIQHLTYILASIKPDDAKVIERIIQKDLKCGVNASTANKVWDNLIPEFPCMLCSQSDDKLASKIKFPAIVQKKSDGMRFNAIVKDGKCEIRSRNGKLISLLDDLESEFVIIANGMNVVFDGELLVQIDGNVMDRQTGNGILNRANKGTITKQEASQVCAEVWDLIPYDQFVAHKCDIKYSDRFNTLSKLINESPNNKVQLIETDWVDNIEQAQQIFEDNLQKGLEGIILKDTSGIWENKRVKTQLKYKAELDADLKIVGIQAGTGKYVGMLGAILCESDDGIIKVSVGSGFTDADRMSLTDDIIGKVVAVKYNGRIKNKQGEESLFLPVFLEIREDKDIADSSTVIK